MEFIKLILNFLFIPSRFQITNDIPVATMNSNGSTNAGLLVVKIISNKESKKEL